MKLRFVNMKLRFHRSLCPPGHGGLYKAAHPCYDSTASDKYLLLDDRATSAGGDDPAVTVQVGTVNLLHIRFP